MIFMKRINKTRLSLSVLFGAILVFATTLLTTSCNNSKGASAADSTGGKVYKLGFIPLTDCAPIVMAKELGLFKKYGVNVEVSKEASWANVRDKILSGELSGAHCLFGMPFSVYTGIG